MPRPNPADSVIETTTADHSGTGPVTPAGAVALARTFAEAYPGHVAADVTDVPYRMWNATQWERGRATFTQAGIIERTTVLFGSDGDGVAVDFAEGAKTIAVVIGTDTLDDVQDQIDALADGVNTKTVTSTQSGTIWDAPTDRMITDVDIPLSPASTAVLTLGFKPGNTASGVSITVTARAADETILATKAFTGMTLASGEPYALTWVFDTDGVDHITVFSLKSGAGVVGATVDVSIVIAGNGGGASDARNGLTAQTSNVVTTDMSTTSTRRQHSDVDGDVTWDASGYAAEVDVVQTITNTSGVTVAFTDLSGIPWGGGEAPTEIAAGATLTIILLSRGTTAADVAIAEWSHP